MVSFLEATPDGQWRQHEVPIVASPAVVETPAPEFFLGLDLGQTVDFSALAIVEAHRPPLSAALHGATEKHYRIRHLQRWPLGSTYARIAADVARLCALPPLSRLEPHPALLVDGTGV